MKIWKILLYVLGVIPWAFTISLMAFYFHAGRVLGHSPSYNQPDPKELDIYMDYAPFIDVSVDIWLWSFVAWFMLSIVYLIVKRKDIQWAPIIIPAIGQFIAILLLLSGVFEWYID